MMTVFTVLKRSKAYAPEHVERLRMQIRDAYVVTISDVPIMNRVPMKHNWPGWFSKMELFRPDIPGDLFYMDLDTTVQGDVRPYQKMDRTTILSDFYRPAQLQSSMMFVTEADRAKIWAAWIADPGAHIQRLQSRRAGFNGDQNFIEEVLGRDVQRWQDVFPGKVVSFKVDLRGKPEPAVRPDIIIFHGNPRPWDVGR